MDRDPFAANMRRNLERFVGRRVGLILPPFKPPGGGSCSEAPVCEVAAGAFRERAMPLYHFDLVNTKTHTDAGDAELPDDIEAMDSADLIARRVLKELPQAKNRDYAILVTNEDGQQICRLPLDVLH
jgi:hypothetical protein